MMYRPDLNDDDTMSPYSQVQNSPPDQQSTPRPDPIEQSPDQQFDSSQPAPPQPPVGGDRPPTSPGRSPGGGLRTGAIIALTVAVLIVFGVGLFAGLQFGQNSAGTSGVNNGLQQSANSKVTVPTLTSNNVEAVREAVISKV
ncbi:MAG TPA: hypothetical protein VH593_04485, partial [Ktedonobacteraceae bacterium]